MSHPWCDRVVWFWISRVENAFFLITLECDTTPVAYAVEFRQGTATTIEES